MMVTRTAGSRVVSVNRVRRLINYTLYGGGRQNRGQARRWFEGLAVAW